MSAHVPRREPRPPGRRPKGAVSRTTGLAISARRLARRAASLSSVDREDPHDTNVRRTPVTGGARWPTSSARSSSSPPSGGGSRRGSAGGIELDTNEREIDELRWLLADAARRAATDEPARAARARLAVARRSRTPPGCARRRRGCGRRDSASAAPRSRANFRVHARADPRHRSRSRRGSGSTPSTRSSPTTAATGWGTFSTPSSTTRRTSASPSAPASRPRTSTRFPSRTSPSCRATRSSSASRRRSSGGTRSRSSSRRTPSRPSSAGTSRATSRPRRSTRSASTTSGARGRTTTSATSSTSRGTPRRGSTRARSSRAGSARNSSAGSARRSRGGGLSSYPHPWLMPDFWQFPTVSMGLGPLMAIYQARFMKYLAARGIVEAADRKVWAFMGDGEMDEPESMGAIALAGRERLDNLVFVVNCNLQRLDGPVRGNGKIIQELETNFRGAGWNVIKVIWGSNWDPLIAADEERLAPPPDGGGRRRRVPDLQGERRRLRARALLRQVPGDAGDGRRLDGRGDLGAPPRRARPEEGVRRVRRRRPAHGPADGDPREDDQGLRHGRRRRGAEHHPPAEGDERRGPARDPRPPRPAPDGRGGDRRLLPPPRRVEPRAPLPDGTARRARRQPARAQRGERAAADARPVHERARGERRARELDDDGLRPHPQRARPRQGARAADRPDRPRRVTDVRHGGDVPPARHLLAGRPALPARGRRRPHVLPRGRARPDPPGGDQRGRAPSRPGSPPRRRTRTTARR